MVSLRRMIKTGALGLRDSVFVENSQIDPNVSPLHFISI